MNVCHCKVYISSIPTNQEKSHQCCINNMAMMRLCIKEGIRMFSTSWSNVYKVARVESQQIERNTHHRWCSSCFSLFHKHTNIYHKQGPIRSVMEATNWIGLLAWAPFHDSILRLLGFIFRHTTHTHRNTHILRLRKIGWVVVLVCLCVLEESGWLVIRTERQIAAIANWW